MALLKRLQESTTYGWIGVLATLGTALGFGLQMFESVYNMELGPLGIMLEVVGFGLILVALVLLWWKLMNVAKGHADLLNKNLELVKKAERLERNLTASAYHLKETQEHVSRLYEETRSYFEFAADVQTYRAEVVMRGDGLMNSEVLFMQRIQEAKAQEWYDLDKHFERRFPNMTPVERKRHLERVLGYQVQ